MRHHSLLLLLCLTGVARAQIGQASLAVVKLARVTVGEPTSPGATDLPVCTATSFTSCAPPYVFIGNGFWDEEDNWLGGIVPPRVLPAGKSIAINPQPGGQCLLNVRQTISAGGSFTVRPDKRLTVLSFLSFSK